MCGETLLRWARTDWPVSPRVHWDMVKEDASAPWGKAARAHRLTDAFAAMLRAALLESGREQGWLLFLEDDLDFHPRLATHLRAWKALSDPRCVFASLFNPSLPAASVPAPVLLNTFSANPSTFVGGQALLLRRSAAQRASDEWDRVPGMTSQRLARMFGGLGSIWVHQPSLVEHVAKDSSWGARVQRALDFDPAKFP